MILMQRPYLLYCILIVWHNNTIIITSNIKTNIVTFNDLYLFLRINLTMLY